MLQTSHGERVRNHTGTAQHNNVRHVRYTRNEFHLSISGSGRIKEGRGASRSDKHIGHGWLLCGSSAGGVTTEFATDDRYVS